MHRIFEKEEDREERSITMDRIKDFRTQRFSYKELKKLFEENKKGKTKEDQIWLETFI